MKSTQVLTYVLFGAFALSAVFMFKTGFKTKVDERTVLAQWPQEVAKALDEYDLDRLADYFVDEFKDQDGTTKQTFKTYLALEKQQSTHWKAIIKSTQVEWDPAIPFEAQLQIHFDLVKFGPQPFEGDVTLKKIDDEWKGVAVTLRRAQFKAPDNKSSPPK
jgi:hypothetical protein